MMLDALLQASVSASIAVVVVASLCTTLRPSPGIRAILWWCVSAKFLAALVWIAPIEVPLLPWTATNSASVTDRPALSVWTRDATPTATDSLMGTNGGTTSVPPSRWHHVIELGWLAGVLVSCGVAGRQWRRARALRRGARPAPDDIQALTTELAATLRLRRVPRTLVSDLTPTPLVMGQRSPAIVLPARELALWSRARARMVIGHELAHIRRHDLVFGWIPALVEHLFFFHPLAHFAARQYAVWREASCDAVVVNELGVEAGEYGQLLLDLGVARPAMTLAAAGNAPWSLSQLRRRIAMLGKPWVPSVRSRVAAGAALVIVATVMLPLTLVGQRPAVETPLKSDLQFVFLLDGGRTISNGGEAQLEKARKQQHRPNEALLWFSQDGLDYVVRDPKAIAAMRQAWQATGDSEIAAAERQVAATLPAEERVEVGRMLAERRLRGEKEFLDEQLTIARKQYEQARAGAEQTRQASGDPEFAVAHPRSRSEAAERERALARNLEMEMVRQQYELERLQEKQLEVFTEQHPLRIARERERLQDKVTEREAELRAQLSELRRAVAMLESRLGVHDTPSVERDLAETRRLLEEVIASGRAERAR